MNPDDIARISDHLEHIADALSRIVMALDTLDNRDSVRRAS